LSILLPKLLAAWRKFASQFDYHEFKVGTEGFDTASSIILLNHYY